MQEFTLNQSELNTLKQWVVILRNISDFVQIAKLDGIRFEIRAKEQGHNIPHLHVSTSSASLSIAIETGEILAQKGKIAPAQLKMAKIWVFENKDLLEKRWNEFSNGIEIKIAV